MQTGMLNKAANNYNYAVLNSNDIIKELELIAVRNANINELTSGKVMQNGKILETHMKSVCQFL